MGRLGCTVDGHLNESRFNQPMPWIGLYVAAASTACALVMAVDLFLGFRSRKLWFPSNFFSLNATTLILIGVAVKLSVDLNTSMPRLQDQLAKLSSDVFLCTVIGNSMPSIGTMENKDMFMNIVALGILVITSMVNICIQLGTGVIYVFWKEHAFVMSLMVVLLTILCSSALSIPTTKSYLELKYKKKHKIAVKECSEQTGDSVSKRLREGMIKYWIMAHTSSPQFVICRSATCTASGAFCLLSAVVLAEAMVRSYFIPRSFNFCDGESDYKWSVTLILMTQTLAVVVGTIAPASRWFTAINFRNPVRANKACSYNYKHLFKVEKYWTLKLVQWKEQPISSTIGGWKGRKLTHNARDRVVDLFITIQTWIVLVCKFVRLISVLIVSRFLICCRLFRTRTGSTNGPDSGSDLDLSRFVTHLEGEEQLVDLLMEDNREALDYWLEMGKKQQPNYLIEFFEKFVSSEEFNGVLNFDSDLVPSLDSEEPPNAWALPLVTLTSIAISLPGVNHDSIKRLTKTVHQGLMYVREVEKNLDTKKELVDIKKAAENIWLGVDLYRKWLDVNLHKLSIQNKTTRQIIEEFSDIAKKKFSEFKTLELNGHLRWPIKMLAANSMYRICETILLDCEVTDNLSGESLFEKLTVLISDILGACLMNLGHVMTIQCLCSAIEERERSVQNASLLLGKMEKVLKILERRPHPRTDLDQLAYIDCWRKLLSRKKGNLQFDSSLKYSETASSSSSDLYINVE